MGGAFKDYLIEGVRFRVFAFKVFFVGSAKILSSIYPQPPKGGYGAVSSITRCPIAARCLQLIVELLEVPFRGFRGDYSV
jgi:hypothetical protein